MALKILDKYQPKKYLGRGRKEKLIEEYDQMIEKATKGGGMVFANYQGLTHHQLEGLKKSVRALDAEFVATKNTLILRSLEKIKLSDEAKKAFVDPTATLFTYGDPIEPIKVMAKLIKETELPKIKFGYIDGAELTDKEILRLSTLPGIDQLRAQLVGTMFSPITGLHRALKFNLTKLAMTLNAISEKKNAAPAATN